MIDESQESEVLALTLSTPPRGIDALQRRTGKVLPGKNCAQAYLLALKRAFRKTSESFGENDYPALGEDERFTPQG